MQATLTLRHRLAGNKLAALSAVFMLAAAAFAQTAAPQSPAEPASAAAPITLENGFIKLVIRPDVGGRIESFVQKSTGKELALTPDKGPYWGLLADGLWQQNFEHSDWNRYPYTVVSQDQFKVVLEGSGKLWAGVKIRKTISLNMTRAAVDVEYTVTSSKPAPQDAKGDLWIHNGIPAGAKVFMPLPAGVVERPVPGYAESWGFEPSRGWIAELTDGAGIAAAMEFDHLRAFRASHQGDTSMDWILRKASLAPGSHFTTWATLAPISGIKSVDGVCRQFAVEMRTGDAADGKTTVKLNIVGFEAVNPTVSVTVRKLPDGQPRQVPQASAALAPGKTVSVAFDAPLPGEGSYVITADFTLNGKSLLQCERLVTVGKPSGVYTMGSQGPRAGEDPDFPTKNRFHPIDMNFNSQDVMPPDHVWAKPYAGGRPKVLFLVYAHAARTAVEFAQRFDVDATIPFNSKTGFYALGDKYLSLNQKDIWNAQEKLILGKKFDVIVIDNACWEDIGDGNKPNITDKCKEYILQLVKDGAGLVMTQRGAEPPDLIDAMPLRHYHYDVARGPYVPQKSTNPVLDAIPWEALPDGHAQNGMKPREKNNNAEISDPAERDAVLVTCGGNPVMATAVWGKGRVAQLAWNSSIIPSFPTVMGRDYKEPGPLDYWEYQYMALARLIYWTARMESPVALRGVDCSSTQIKLSLQSNKWSGPAKIEWRLRDKFGTILHSATASADIKDGDNTIALDVPASVGGSYWLADAVVKSDKVALAFGGGVLKRQALQIRGVKTDKPVYAPGDTAQVAVDLTAPASGVAAGDKIRVEVFDGSARKVAQVDVPAAGAATTLPAPLAGIIGTVVEFHVSLLDNNGVIIDQAVGAARLTPDRLAQRAKFQTFFWGSPGNAYPPYLTRKAYLLFNDIGMTAEEESEAPLINGRRELEYLNMPYICGSVGMAANNGITRKEADTPLTPSQIAGWHKEGVNLPDNAVKADQPVFTSPYAAEGLRNGAAKVAKQRLDWNLLMFSMGDECRAPLPGTDFSKIGLEEFRKWLKETQYPTLAGLNAEWKTNFESFDAVMPMTEDEVRAHAKATQSYAPWADQQQFNKWVWAHRAHEAMAGFFSIDPATRAGESGTQEPGAYSGRDYWLLHDTYTALAAYGGEQENQELSYWTDLLRYTWAGYGKPNPILRTSIWPLLGNINHGFGVFHDESHYDPDFTLPECGRDLRSTTLDMVNGAGQLMVEAKPLLDPVYLYQSSASIHGDYMLPGGQEIGRAGRLGAGDLLTDLDVSYRSMSYEQVAQGRLEAAGARVLLLPYIVALSDAEAQAIRKWVQAGGILVADLDPGIMTQHCRLLDKGQLDDVLGIDRAGAKLHLAKPADAWSVGAGADTLSVTAIETGLKGEAKPIWTASMGKESAPALYVNSFGKGKAYYFACDFFKAYGDAYLNAGTGSKYAHAYKQVLVAQAAIEKILKDSGWTAPASAMSMADGKPARTSFFRIYPKASGTQRYFILDRNQGIYEAGVPDVTATVAFDRPGYIYDTLAGRELGFGDKLDIVLTDYTVRLLSVLPYRVLGMTAQAPASVRAGQNAVINAAVKTDGKPEMHVFRLDVWSPTGVPNRTYSRNVVAREGQADITIPFALNDDPGDWTITLRDVASGAAVQKTIKLEAGR